jgi:hypothetical protein
MQRRLRWALAGAPMLVICASGAALADTLTRSNCWLATFGDTDKRILCFLGFGKVTMTDAAVDSTSWSTCNFSGNYKKDGDGVTVTFPANSGRCTNGASSPELTAVCTFTGNTLPCKGTSFAPGKTYEFEGIFR